MQLALLFTNRLIIQKTLEEKCLKMQMKDEILYRNKTSLTITSGFQVLFPVIDKRVNNHIKQNIFHFKNKS